MQGHSNYQTRCSRQQREGIGHFRACKHACHGCAGSDSDLETDRNHSQAVAAAYLCALEADIQSGNFEKPGNEARTSP